MFGSSKTVFGLKLDRKSLFGLLNGSRENVIIKISEEPLGETIEQQKLFLDILTDGCSIHRMRKLHMISNSKNCSI